MLIAGHQSYFLISHTEEAFSSWDDNVAFVDFQRDDPHHRRFVAAFLLKPAFVRYRIATASLRFRALLLQC